MWPQSTHVEANIISAHYNHGAHGLVAAPHVELEPKLEVNLFVVIPVSLI
jgi:hypothetical protein